MNCQSRRWRWQKAADKDPKRAGTKGHVALDVTRKMGEVKA